MILAQGGNPDAVLKLAAVHDVVASHDGVVSGIETEQLGTAIIAMGGGRRLMSDRVDPSVGIRMCVRLGDRVDRGQLLAQVFSSHPEEPIRLVKKAILISDSGAAPRFDGGSDFRLMSDETQGVEFVLGLLAMHPERGESCC